MSFIVLYYLLCIGKVNTRKTKGKTRKAHIFFLPCGFPERLASISNGIGLGNFICQSRKDWLPGADESLKLFVKVVSLWLKVNTAETKKMKMCCRILVKC